MPAACNASAAVRGCPELKLLILYKCRSDIYLRPLNTELRAHRSLELKLLILYKCCSDREQELCQFSRSSQFLHNTVHDHSNLMIKLMHVPTLRAWPLLWLEKLRPQVYKLEHDTSHAFAIALQLLCRDKRLGYYTRKWTLILPMIREAPDSFKNVSGCFIIELFSDGVVPIRFCEKAQHVAQANSVHPISLIATVFRNAIVR